MKKISICAAILTMMALCNPVIAHEALYSDCVGPERPVDDANDVLWQRFLAEIDTYRACVRRVMDQHQLAASEHQAAARSAVTSWNEFVRTSLNAPEDFPWPPDD